MLVLCLLLHRRILVELLGMRSIRLEKAEMDGNSDYAVGGRENEKKEHFYLKMKSKSILKTEMELKLKNKCVENVKRR
ncbi:hypothetical protein SAY87_030217 [Trapa incisa]|uniref:Uncharacterized protein n=1 Tax=Trapa incisa TaxID=236973 RepID=A0AAN7QMT7_9MYRT|nr:hypothetical protein SAY87_030217 [Trapa incisa]